MITFDKSMTIETARKLTQSIGMIYPTTDHNKKMMAQATDEILVKLRGTRAECLAKAEIK